MALNTINVQYKNQGFTIIELVLVILLLGIMAATIAPKMTSTEGYAEHAYINEVVTKLRTIQLRAMQNTQDNVCRDVIITSKTLGSDDSCDLWDLGTTLVEITEDEMSFDITQDTSFSFDSWGRPINCDTSPCLVVISGREGDLIVQIESEGFIHVSS